MRIGAMTFTLHAGWCRSLKDKRSVVKSLLAKLENRFHVSAAEVGEQDVHQTIRIGVAFVAAPGVNIDARMEKISAFVQENTDAEVTDEEWEVL